jgi:hypothetical protein
MVRAETARRIFGHCPLTGDRCFGKCALDCGVSLYTLRLSAVSSILRPLERAFSEMETATVADPASGLAGDIGAGRRAQFRKEVTRIFGSAAVVRSGEVGGGRKFALYRKAVRDWVVL